MSAGSTVITAILTSGSKLTQIVTYILRYAIPVIVIQYMCWVHMMPKFRIEQQEDTRKRPQQKVQFFSIKAWLKVSVEFSDGEHGLNCLFEFWAEDCETFLDCNSRGLTFKWYDCINQIFTLFIHFALRMLSRWCRNVSY